MTTLRCRSSRMSSAKHEMSSTSDPLNAGKLPAKLLAAFLARQDVSDDPSVLVSAAPGFDAAVVQSDSEIIVKSDPVTFATANPADYLVAVNANDIACLGGIPRWMTVTALFPEGPTTADHVGTVFDRLSDACRRSDVSLIGGHTEITPGIDRLLLCGTMIGVPGERGVLRPGGARSGDDIYLTQSAGIEGTAILATEMPGSHLRGLSDAVIRAAAVMVENPGISIVRPAAIARSLEAVTAMHDPTEGGVVTAVHELADAAELGFELDADHIPIAEATRHLTDHFAISPLGLLSSGALLFTASAGSNRHIESAFTAADIPVARIGTMTATPDVRTARFGDARRDAPRYDADEITRVFARL